MAQLPLIKLPDPQAMDMETKWKAILDPVIATPISNGLLLTNINLVVGATIINHKLGRMMQGWIITDITDNIGAQIYKSAPLNDKTLTLTSAISTKIALWVF